MNNFEIENKEIEINIESENLIVNGLSIGTVEKGDEASATITGTSPNQKLNLVLPQGEQGPQGIQGEQGPQGLKGDTGETGPQGPAGQDGTDGTDGITPTIGENGNWYLGETDTGKPSRGEQGPQGLKGETGEQGPQGIQGEQGPQGLKGDTGEAGPQGPAGADGTDGVSPNISVKVNNATQYILTVTDAEDSFDTPNLKGQNGADGQDGVDGTSVLVIEATDENNALTLSTQNPNNIYFWEE